MFTGIINRISLLLIIKSLINESSTTYLTSYVIINQTDAIIKDGNVMVQVEFFYGRATIFLWR